MDKPHTILKVYAFGSFSRKVLVAEIHVETDDANVTHNTIYFDENSIANGAGQIREIFENNRYMGEKMIESVKRDLLLRQSGNVEIVELTSW